MPQKAPHKNPAIAVLSLQACTASLTAMTAAAYCELERVLGQALKGFSATRQKLNPYERGVRDRIAKILDEVAQLRARRETPDLPLTRGV